MKAYSLKLVTLLFSLSLTSCNRQKEIMAEKVATEAESQRTWAEYTSYEQKFKALGPNGNQVSMMLEDQIKKSEKAAAALEQEVSVLSTRVAALEGALTTYRPKVDAYKALHLR